MKGAANFTVAFGTLLGNLLGNRSLLGSTSPLGCCLLSMSPMKGAANFTACCLWYVTWKPSWKQKPSWEHKLSWLQAAGLETGALLGAQAFLAAGLELETRAFLSGALTEVIVFFDSMQLLHKFHLLGVAEASKSLPSDESELVFDAVSDAMACIGTWTYTASNTAAIAMVQRVPVGKS